MAGSGFTFVRFLFLMATELDCIACMDGWELAMRMAACMCPCVPPEITTTSLPDGPYGVAYSQQILQTGSQGTYTVSAGALPAGLTMNSAGLITGTPTAVETATFTVTVTNSCGTDTQVLSIEITCVAPVITTTTLPNPVNGVAYNQTILASGSPSTFAVTAGTLPTGLSLSSGGVLSGTPTVNAVFTFTVTATNPCGSDPQAYSVTVSNLCVAPVITTTTLPNPVVGTAYSQTVVASGTASTFAVTSGTLPNGLSIAAGGAITGTPTVAGPFSFTITATNPCGSDPQAYSVTVAAACVPPVITTTTLPDGVVGTAYGQNILASGNASTFAVTSGTLPAGLSLSAGGSLTGTPTTATSYSFTVTATNACGSDPQAYTVNITATAVTLRYGNIVYPDFPTAAPTFVAGDFTGSGPLFGDYTEVAAISPVSRANTYVFPTAAGVRQVMWVADSLLTGSPSFVVDGLPWVIDPGANLPLQSLTIAGIPGKVYFTFYQNTGTYNLVVT
jgi:hypothetical protein